MSVLLDTHVWLWWNMDAEMIPGRTRKLIERASQQDALFLAAISVWELSWLVSKKQFNVDGDVMLWVDQALDERGLTLYPLTHSIAVECNRLPGNFHSDPADRIIVATAMELGATLATKDAKIQAYPFVTWCW